MAHFAKVENGKVANVIVIKNDDCAGGDMPSSEAVGREFINSLGIGGEWFQTSYNGNFRGNFAGIGMSWDGAVFFGEAPFESWVLNASGAWRPPHAMPDDGLKYYWHEPTLSWVEVS